MEIKKGYKQTEVGVIPEDWQVKKIGEISTISVGRDLRKEIFSNYTDNIYKYPVYSNTVENEGLYGYYSCAEYDGDSLTVVGRGIGLGTAFQRQGGYGAIGRLLVIFPNKLADSNFLTEYINFKVKIFEESSGIPQLTGVSFANYKIPLPPTLAEQSAIATVLSDTDDLIQALEKLIVKKRLIKYGTMQELLEPKDDWLEKKLGELFNFSGGYTASRDQLSQEGFCYLHYGDIHGSKKTFINVMEDYTDIPKLNVPLKAVAQSSLLNDGDVVFVDASEDDEGTSRHIVVDNSEGIPFISGLHTIVAKSKDNLVNNTYKRYCFQGEDVKKQFKFYAVGTKVSGISKANIEKITIFLPPTIIEQTRIATILSDMDAEILALETKLDKYKQIKLGMMQELLTGRIRLV